MVQLLSSVRWMQVRSCSLGRAWRPNSMHAPCMQWAHAVGACTAVRACMCSMGASYFASYVPWLAMWCVHAPRECESGKCGHTPCLAPGAPVSVCDGPLVASCGVVRRGSDAGGARRGLQLAPAAGCATAPFGLAVAAGALFSLALPIGSYLSGGRRRERA
jgi:hypothetical protein